MTNATVTAEITCSIILPGHEPFAGHVAMLWDMNSPFQLTLDFTNRDDSHTEWIIGRDMVADCLLNGPGPLFGGGDATLDRGMATMRLNLATPDDGSADVYMPLTPVIAFMTQTLHLVPRGAAEYERIATELDEFLEEVLGDGDE